MHIQHDTERHQFVIELEDGSKAALSYQKHDEQQLLDFYSVFVPPQGRGKGIAAGLVKHGFNYARENNLQVRPTCPYISGTFLKRYPEYNDLTE